MGDFRKEKIIQQENLEVLHILDAIDECNAAEVFTRDVRKEPGRDSSDEPHRDQPARKGSEIPPVLGSVCRPWRGAQFFHQQDCPTTKCGHRG